MSKKTMVKNIIGAACIALALSIVDYFYSGFDMHLVLIMVLIYQLVISIRLYIVKRKENE